MSRLNSPRRLEELESKSDESLDSNGERFNAQRSLSLRVDALQQTCFETRDSLDNLTRMIESLMRAQKQPTSETLVSSTTSLALELHPQEETSLPHVKAPLPLQRTAQLGKERADHGTQDVRYQNQEQHYAQGPSSSHTLPVSRSSAAILSSFSPVPPRQHVFMERPSPFLRHGISSTSSLSRPHQHVETEEDDMPYLRHSSSSSAMTPASNKNGDFTDKDVKQQWPPAETESYFLADGQIDWFRMLAIKANEDKTVYKQIHQADKLPRPILYSGQKAHESVGDARAFYTKWVKHAKQYVCSLSKQQPQTLKELLNTFACLHEDAPLSAILSELEEQGLRNTFSTLEKAVLDSIGPDDSIIKRQLALENIKRQQSQPLSTFTETFALAVQNIVRTATMTREAIATAWCRALNDELKVFVMTEFERDSVWSSCPVDSAEGIKENYMALVNWLKRLTLISEAELNKNRVVQHSFARPNQQWQHSVSSRNASSRFEVIAKPTASTETTAPRASTSTLDQNNNPAPRATASSQESTSSPLRRLSPHQVIKDQIGQEEYNNRFKNQICVKCCKTRREHGRDGFRNCERVLETKRFIATSQSNSAGAANLETVAESSLIFNLELLTLYGEDAVTTAMSQEGSNNAAADEDDFENLNYYGRDI